MLRPALFLSAIAFLVQSASAEGEDYARQAVELFDELAACSAEDSFMALGLARGGPCGDWVDRVEALQENDMQIIQAGFSCLAGDVRVAGHSKVFGDREHFNFVREVVEECREDLR